MPEVSRFYGIIIRIFFRDHQPPHFHAIYGEYEAVVEIETREIVRGEIPSRALAMVREWASLRRNELRRDWDLAHSGQPVRPIAPLD
jgi:hypothetical protein